MTVRAVSCIIAAAAAFWLRDDMTRDAHARFQTILATTLLWFLTHLQINILGMVLRGWLPQLSAESRTDIQGTLHSLVHFAQGTAAVFVIGLALVLWFSRKAPVEKFMAWCGVLQCLLLASGFLVFYKFTHPRFIQWERAYMAQVEDAVRRARAAPGPADVRK